MKLKLTSEVSRGDYPGGGGDLATLRGTVFLGRRREDKLGRKDLEVLADLQVWYKWSVGWGGKTEEVFPFA